MNNILEVQNCTNCGACVNACPVHAISVDASGLFYQCKVDQEQCISCGKCKAVCPALCEAPEQDRPRAAYAAKHRDAATVRSSSSGGAFHGLARTVLQNGGVVFGACFSEDRKSVLLRSTEEVPLSELLRSKYVESLTGTSFQEAKRFLEAEREVLFCAAPCQIAGLKAFLGRKYKTLTTCDFTCGGFPSHRMFSEHIAALERRYRAAAVSVNFRPKTYGWENHSLQVLFENGKRYERLAQSDPYLRGFLFDHTVNRFNCDACRFASRHASDLTLADFWLYRRFPALTTPADGGLSLVLVHTQRGGMLLARAEDDLLLEELPVEEAGYNLKQREPKPERLQREKMFLSDCDKIGFEAAAKPFLPKLPERMKLAVKAAISRGKP